MRELQTKLFSRILISEYINTAGPLNPQGAGNMLPSGNI